MIDPDPRYYNTDVGAANRAQRIALTVFLLGFVAIATGFLVSGINRGQDEAMLRAKGTHVQAVVEQHYVTNQASDRNGVNHNSNIVVVRYVVGGVPVHHTFDVNGPSFDRLTPGATTELIFDPANPYLVMMAGSGDTQTGSNLVVICSVAIVFALSCLAAIWIYWLRRMSAER